ncbi:helix-turn-helix domain-containing protein [Dyadobacter sp. BHUBP1]|uniref:helix-turn-helix domain-containing protein n=1 Tax=Dyadobacter sp. BHUBP1 TaxID=3424178 RepID=UPI003D325114
MSQKYITSGSTVSHMGELYQVKLVLDATRVLAHRQQSDDLKILGIDELVPVYENGTRVSDIGQASEKAWETANKRYGIIRPVLENRGDGELVKRLSKQHRVSVATIYRWVERFETMGVVSSLMDISRDGGKGKTRIPEEVDIVIQDAIKTQYLTRQRKPLGKVYQTVASVCKQAGLPLPHSNTIRNRVLQIADYTRLRYRFGADAAQEQLAPHRGSFPGAESVLSVVQIDHTKLDIILVDKVERRPVGRPWITMAIDVYSRMVVGFYISFDPPGAIGTGLCLANSILPKEQWLAKYDLGGEWPCWGTMKTIHLDNAKEFRGTMLKRACEEYGITLKWRPVKAPRYGGHIERFLGTVLGEIHTLSGSTFSNPRERGGYRSEEKSTMTLEELEVWLLKFITEIYHVRLHSGIGCTPLERFKQGLLGKDGEQGIGLPFRYANEDKVRLDFMPFQERTVQEYGVMIDHICYYSDVLRRWIKATDWTKYEHRRKLLFRRDPRDISVIYFFDPELKEYFPIPYRDTSRPAISIWEHRKALKALEKQKTAVNEDGIFMAYEQLRQIEANSANLTRKARKNTERPAVHEPFLASLPRTEIEDVAQTESHAVSGQFKPFDLL